MNIQLLLLSLAVLTLSACGGGGGGNSSSSDGNIETTSPGSDNSGSDSDNPDVAVDNGNSSTTPSQPTPSQPKPSEPTPAEPDSINQATYYADAIGETGYSLKTALSRIISLGHIDRGYNWVFFNANDRDLYFENDGSILDIYSENPTAADPYHYVIASDQCGNFNSENDCYNREHAFPQSWFDRDYPMRSDVHHLFATDGFVNSRRSNHPYGNVSSASWTSRNGSKLGNEASAQFNGTVFEPIDEFKGDLARAYFYIATRYENRIANWQGNGTADNVLNGTANQVFDSWHLNLLKAWHQLDPVSQKERDRNQAAFAYQGNRNPFVDNPQWVNVIWGQ
ncbi:endonuclease [Bacterioplanoides sp.]|uniref:HNH endonuclease signature motif containing protein n=1 Tax=Bacterioplanoides sp. TaxID=2066072 RepID=UPI003AFFB544